MPSAWAPPPLALALALHHSGQPDDTLVPSIPSSSTNTQLRPADSDDAGSSNEDDDDDDDDDDTSDSDPWATPSRPRRSLWDLSTQRDRRILIQGRAPGSLHILTAKRAPSHAALPEPPSPSTSSSLASPHATPVGRPPSAIGIQASTSLDTSLALAGEAQLTSPSSATHHADAEELLEAQYHGGRMSSSNGWSGAHIGTHHHHHHHHSHHHLPSHREQSSSSSSSSAIEAPRPTSQRVASHVNREERKSQLLESGAQTPATSLSIPPAMPASPLDAPLRPTALLQFPSASSVVKVLPLRAHQEALALQRDGSLTWLDRDLRACASLCLDEPSDSVQTLQQPTQGNGDGRAPPAMASTMALNEASSSTPLLAPFSHLKDLLRPGSEAADGSRSASPAPGGTVKSASASMSRATSTLTASALAKGKGKGKERDALALSLSGLREGFEWISMALEESGGMDGQGAGDEPISVVVWTSAKWGRATKLVQVRLERDDRKLAITRALEVEVGTGSMDAALLQDGSVRLRWMADVADPDADVDKRSHLQQWVIAADIPPQQQQGGVLTTIPSTDPVASPGLAKELASLPGDAARHVEVHAGLCVAFADDGTAHIVERRSARLKLLGQDVIGVSAVDGVGGMATTATATATATPLLLVLTCTGDGMLSIHEIDPDGPRKVLWTAAPKRKATSRITAALPLSLERVLVAICGSVHLRPLSALVGCSVTSAPPDAPRMSGTITLLRQTTHTKDGAKLIVAGTRQGDVGFFAVDTSSATLLAQWSLFASPLAHVLSIGEDSGKLRLNGCIAAVAVDGTVAIILVEGLKLLYHIPGRGAPLLLLAARSDELLLLYADSRARAWDLRSQELRRSVGLDQALSMLDDDASPWTRHALHQDVASTAGVLTPLVAPRSALRADLRRAIEASSRAVETGEPSASPGARRALSVLRPLLFSLVGADIDVGPDVQALLELREADVAAVPCIGSIGGEGEVRLSSSKLSPGPTQLLAALAMLNVLAKVKEWQSPTTAIAARLVANITQLPIHACLPELAVHFIDTSAEIREASRALFTAAMDAAAEADMERLCDEWQPLLPSRRAEDARSPSTLLLLGVVAATHYKSLSPALLKDVSASIAAYIADEAHPERQIIAMELCCRAWSVWQSYLDAMEVVRTIFGLATASSQAAPLELRRSLARRATLQIAAENTPLFMTTLSLDILHARSPAHCSATMRLVAFMVRGEPLILHPSLPRLAEAVVKSLDPTATAFREAVVEAATVMIGELVRAYPTIAFHGKLQRLAVGTHEGAVIMYDLRTATRLYVIEAHRAQLSGLDFSPDGRRLLTVSVRERRALVWKVGSTLASIFAPGSLPRQGGDNDAGAYKAVPLNPAANDELPSPEQPLHAVLFQWLGDRNAHITVGSLQRSIDVS